MPTGGADFVLADVLVDAAVGAGIGGVTSAVTGGNPLTGALLGGVSGGAIGGFGGPVGDALGIGAVGGDALVGGAVGALGSAVTGGNPLVGGVTGAAGGALTGALSTPGGTSAGAPTSGGASAVGSIAPAGAAPIDLTGVNTGGFDVGGGLTGPTVGAPSTGGAAPDLGGFNAGGGLTTSTGINTAADLGNLNAGGGGNIGTGAPTSQASLLSGTAPIGGASGANLGTISGDTGLISPPAAAGGVTSSGGKAPFNYNDSTLGKVMNDLGLPQGAITEGIAKNPGALVAGGGLLFNMLQNQNLPGQDRLKAQADQLNAQGQQLANYLLQGNLPPGLQAAVDQAKQSARASIISRYAAQNPSGANPATNSALQQELAAADMQAVIFTAQIGEQLLQQGVTEAGLSSQLYEQILNINQKQAASSGSAIANFAAALNGGGGTTIRLGGSNN